MNKPSQTAKVFISYSHKDKEWLERLKVHLAPLTRQNSEVLKIWDDTQLRVGDKWSDEIEKAMASAEVCLLLVSANFLASDFVIHTELPTILDSAKRRGVLIVPIILSYCRFAKHEELRHYQSRPGPDTPLASLNEAEQDKVLYELSVEIEEVLKTRERAANSPTLEPVGFLSDQELLTFYSDEVSSGRVLKLFGNFLPLTIPKEVADILAPDGQLDKIELIPIEQTYTPITPRGAESNVREGFKINKEYRTQNKISTYNSANRKFHKIRRSEEGYVTIELCLVNYYDYLKTNMVLDYKSALHANSSLRETIHSQHSISPPWEEASLANHIGVSMLLLSAEGWLIVQRRSSSQGIDRELCGPSVSGALDALHLDGKTSFNDFWPKNEAYEELRISAREISHKQYLGTYVDMKRAKPEMSWIAKSTLEFDSLQSTVANHDAPDSKETEELIYWDLGVYDWENLTTVTPDQLTRIEDRLKFYLTQIPVSLSLKGSLSLWMSQLSGVLSPLPASG